MKRIISVLCVSFLLSLSFFNLRFNINQDDKKRSFSLENIDALAAGNGEIDFTFCAVINNNICVMYSDGYFLIGFRQYG
jgi:hypothetical protein